MTQRVKVYGAVGGVLAIAWLVIFWPFLFGGKIVGELDTKLVFLPLEWAYRFFQSQGQLPWWSSEFGFGHPLLAWGQLGFFVPVHFLLRAFHVNPLLLLSLSPPIYMLVGLAGMFVFLRNRSLHPVAAGFGAVVFALNGFGAAHLLHVNFYVVTMLAPWLLVALVRLIESPSLTRSLIVAVVAGVIAESGHPTMVILTFIIAGIMAGGYMIRTKFLVKLVLYVLLAGVIGFGLASTRLLPLSELFGQSQRAQGMSLEELYDFSYPPWHAVTLVVPRFFWNAGKYWGPKSFWELGAFVGIIPLLLGGLSLTSWRRHHVERAAGILLVVGGMALALGKYSPVYRELVRHEFWSSVGVGGRYMYLVVTGLALLSAVAVQDWLQAESRKRLWGVLMFPLAIAIPFTYMVWRVDRFREALTLAHTVVGWWEIGIAFVSSMIILFFTPERWRPAGALLLLGLTSASLVWHHGDFYHLTARSALAPNPQFAAVLTQYRQDHGVPPRLYTRPTLWQEKPDYHLPQGSRRTDVLGADLELVQPIHADQGHLGCLAIPLEWVEGKGVLHVEVRSDRTGPAVRATEGSGESQDGYVGPLFCFEPIPDSEGKNYWIVVSALASSDKARLWFVPEVEPERQAYFLRVEPPTLQEWERSRKDVHVLIGPVYASEADIDMVLLDVHAQVLANASSARWLGSLPIERYESFIEKFFASSRTTVDGEGKSVLERHRKIFDMAGVTHFSQLLLPGARDRMVDGGFDIVARQKFWGKEARLYSNPHAFPKAFLVPRGEKVSSLEEAFARMDTPEFDPKAVTYIEGSIDSAQLPVPSVSTKGEAKITAYGDQQVEVQTETEAPMVLVLSDAASPLWETRVDGSVQTSLVANGVFRAAVVPAGTHAVTFTFHSKTAEFSTAMAKVSAAVVVLGLASQVLWRSRLV